MPDTAGACINVCPFSWQTEMSYSSSSMVEFLIGYNVIITQAAL